MANSKKPVQADSVEAPEAPTVNEPAPEPKVEEDKQVAAKLRDLKEAPGPQEGL